VVGSAISANNEQRHRARARRTPPRRPQPPPRACGLLHHTDRGSPYASDDYREALASHAMIASMSRKGDCWDNAPSESFFATLRAELVDRREVP